MLLADVLWGGGGNHDNRMRLEVLFQVFFKVGRIVLFERCKVFYLMISMILFVILFN